MREIIILACYAIVLFCLETWYDQLRWRQRKSDKPWSTIARGVLMLAFCWILPGALLNNIATLASMYFFGFDFAINIARWKVIPVPTYWRLTKLMIDYLRRLGSLDLVTMEAQILGLYRNKKSRRRLVKQLHPKYRWKYYYIFVSGKLFYHGIRDTMSWKNVNQWYDLFWERIPPEGELLFKLAVLIAGISVNL